MKAEWIRLIHTAKGKLSLDDTAYRALLEGAAGISSSREIQNYGQFKAIMSAFRKLGFEPLNPLDSWGCSERQRGRILGLWNHATGGNDLKGLLGFVKRTAHVDSFRFLTPALASKVILGLEAMDANPKGGRK